MIVTPMLSLCTSMPQAAVLGTSLLCMVPPSLAALVQHWRLGNVDPKLGAALALGTLVGGGVGSHVAVQVPNGTTCAWYWCVFGAWQQCCCGVCQVCTTAYDDC